MRAWVAIVVFVLAGCGGKAGAPAPERPVPVPADERGAPIAMVLPALDGGELELASLRGKIVVLHFFTTWSLAAQAEIESLIAADAAEDVQVIGVALDPEGRALVAPWRNASGVRYLVTLGAGAVAEGTSPLGRISTVPTTIILDRRGRVHARIERALAPGEIESVLAAARAE